jgi:hypothetical protein
VELVIGRIAAVLLSSFIFGSAGAEARVRVTGWRVTLVNQEVRRVPAHGSLPLCQAIPPITIGPRLRGRDDRTVQLRLRAPGGSSQSRRVTPGVAPVFVPMGLGLDAFQPGRYRLQVRRGGRLLARASLRFAGAPGPC